MTLPASNASLADHLSNSSLSNFQLLLFLDSSKYSFNHQASSKRSPYSFRYVRQASCMLASVMGSQKISWPTRDSTFASPDRRAQFTMTFGAAKALNSKCKANLRLAKVASEITQLYRLYNLYIYIYYIYWYPYDIHLLPFCPQPEHLLEWVE